LLRIEATRIVLQHAGDRPVVGNLGPTSDELWALGHRDRSFYTYGSMGLCSSIALGMALSSDGQVISLDGDGSLLMNMGAIATIAREKPPNLIVVVWDNEEWCQTGHQPSHTATGTDLESVAKGCGILHTATVTSEEQFETVFKQALAQPGPWFIVAKVEEAGHIEAAPIEPELTLHRFRSTFPQSASNPHTQPWHKPDSTA